MPPRKKAGATDHADPSADAATIATRSSSRIAMAASTSAAAGHASKPVPTHVSNVAPKKPLPKPASKPASKLASSSKQKSKRARDDFDEEDKPPAKKAKGDKIEDDAESAEEQDEVKADEPKKITTVLKRGAAPVDQYSGMVATHQVYADDQDVWDAMLNQTDLTKNANKFYVLQLLHPIGNSSSCTLFTRWGRVGENGASQSKGPFPPAQAVNEFKKQFKSKAAVSWENRKGMTAKKGKYTWIERSFEDDEPEDKEGDSGEDTEEEIIPDSTLASELQIFCKFIFSAALIDATLTSMNYDANKLPLGKLAKSTILSGFAALKELAEVIEHPNGDLAKTFGNFGEACNDLTGRYYSIIPHAFGRGRPPTISTMPVLKKELELVDALGDMEVASKLISDSTPRDERGHAMNPLDAHFRSLQLSLMEPVATRSKEFDALEAYARDTHGHTHTFQAQLQFAFRVERQTETDAWTKSKFDKLNDGERMLLWHGSRSTNFAGILKQGLRIAPPEAPSTGYMFGKGVYFADMMTKSANYCHAYLSDHVGILLLCEVAVKPWVEMNNANYDAGQVCKREQKLATKGIGMTQPVEWQDAGEALNNAALRGCTMPKGKGQSVGSSGACLQYNEYIVYDPSQIRVRYLLMVKLE